MSTKTKKTSDSKVVVVSEQPRPLMPVTRLVSRPSVCIVNGVLSAVMQVVLKAA